jgi:hypothetical protein
MSGARLSPEPACCLCLSAKPHSPQMVLTKKNYGAAPSLLLDKVAVAADGLSRKSGKKGGRGFTTSIHLEKQGF